MKLLFFSDIHGMASALEQLLVHVERLRPDRMILLGDVLYHGPRSEAADPYDPSRAAAMLNAHKDMLLAVRGNCDAEVDQMLLKFPIMSDYAEILCDGQGFFLTHGHKWNEAHLPETAAGTILVHGHTHVPEYKKTERGMRIFNPGSISLPRAGFPPSFGFYDHGDLSVRRLDDGGVLIRAE